MMTLRECLLDKMVAWLGITPSEALLTYASHMVSHMEGENQFRELYELPLDTEMQRVDTIDLWDASDGHWYYWQFKLVDGRKICLARKQYSYNYAKSYFKSDALTANN